MDHMVMLIKYLSWEDKVHFYPSVNLLSLFYDSVIVPFCVPFQVSTKERLCPSLP